MKKTIFFLAILHFTCCAVPFALAQDTLWVRYDDRFKANGIISIKGADSVEFRTTQMRVYNPELTQGYRNITTTNIVPTDESEMSFTNPGRYLLKPNTYSGTDYTNANAKSGYNFAHCMESDHYAVFWDARYGELVFLVYSEFTAATTSRVAPEKEWANPFATRLWKMFSTDLNKLESH